MRKVLSRVSLRMGIWLWFLISAVVIFMLSVAVLAIARQPPFMDLFYITACSFFFPALFIGLLRLMACRRNG